MTDQLATLLHDEASALEVPPPPTDAVLARGHAVRRRRRTTRAVAGAVAAVLVIGVAAAAAGAWRQDGRLEPARLPDRAAYQQRGAWAVGDEVHVGNHVAVVPGAHDLRYTSAGVIVFSPGTPFDDPQHHLDSRVTLVTPAGDVRELHQTGLEDLGIHPPATDPTTPDIAYIRDAGHGLSELVVTDLETGEDHVVGDPWRSQHGSDIAENLSGDHVFYLRRGGVRMVDWRTGERLPVSRYGLFPTNGLGGDAYIASDDSGWQVRSRAGGRVLLDVPYDGTGYYESSALSLDGRWFAASTSTGFRVYDVRSGDHVDFGGGRVLDGYGWTPDGHLVGKQYRLNRSEVQVCDPATGDCRGTGTEVAPALTLMPGAVGIAR